MFGINKRNVPYRTAQKNPLPENKMSSATGDAGVDGYQVLSEADRLTGSRPSAGGQPVVEHPRDYLL